MMQEADKPEKCYTYTDNISNLTTDKPMVANNENSKIKYFLPGPKQDNDKKVSTEIRAAAKRF